MRSPPKKATGTFALSKAFTDSPAAARSTVLRYLLGFDSFSHILKQRTAVRINQEELENMIDRSIGFALANQFESCHHVVDLFGRSRQEQPAINIGALRTRIGEKLLGLIMLGVYGYRHDASFRSKFRPESIGDLSHSRCEQKARSGTGSVDEIEQHRFPLQGGKGNLPAVLIDQGDVGQAVGGIAHRESTTLPNILRMPAATHQSYRARKDYQHR
jgi:hypothetical protein